MAGGTPSHTSEKVVGSIPSQGTYRFQVRSPFGAHAEGSFLSHQSLSLSVKAYLWGVKEKKKGGRAQASLIAFEEASLSP